MSQHRDVHGRFERGVVSPFIALSPSATVANVQPEVPTRSKTSDTHAIVVPVISALHERCLFRPRSTRGVKDRCTAYIQREGAVTRILEANRSRESDVLYGRSKRTLGTRAGKR